MWRVVTMVVAVASLLSLAGGPADAQEKEKKKPSGTVELSEGAVAVGIVAWVLFRVFGRRNG